MKRLLLILLVVPLCFTSCKKDQHEPPFPSETEQTVFMYMPWSSNLTSYFIQNIADFESAIRKNIIRNERVVVFFATSPTEATLFELKYNKGTCVRKTLKEYTNPAFTSANWITSILNDVKAFAPANRYGMIISCHGMGWLPVSGTKARDVGQKYHWENEGVLQTRFFGGLTSEYQTEIKTLADGITNAGMKMEYILFDDCYMSTIEVAYDLKDVTDYLIASPTEVMVYGFPYATIGKYLIGDVDYYGICNGFFTFYQNYTVMPCGTIGVTKCAELDNLASVMKEINQRFTIDPTLLNNIQRLDGYSPIIFFDLGDYVNKLCSDEYLRSKFEYQFERTVPSQLSMHTKSYYSMSRGEVDINTFSGITISDPSVSLMASKKTETAWYKATH